MGKITTKAVFKQYDPGQALLLPPTLGELVPKNHLVRLVNKVVDKMNLSDIINQYEGGGTSSYHPVMMTKVMLYAYCMKIYTGRKIAKALRQDITFMWLAAWNSPDFRTINLFRSGVLKDTIESLFQEMLLFLLEEGYIKMEDYFCDGSTFVADANKRKIVWRKNAARYKKAALEKCTDLFKQIDELNSKEEQQYGTNDLAEVSGKTIDETTINEKVEQLNQVIANNEEKRKQRKAASLQKKLIEQKSKIEKYQNQEDLSAGRSGYSTTDPDATAMFMKDEQILPAYNVLIGTENQFITGFSVHQNTNDATCFKDHLEEISKYQPQSPASITADSIFGTEQNYELLEHKQIDNYLKYPTFHKEEKASFSKKIFLKENFQYDPQADSYKCPNGVGLEFKHETKQTHQKTGYVSKIKVYEARNCEGCPFAKECKKSDEKNRIIKVNAKLEKYKQQAKANLKSEQGIKKRKQRNCDVESCYGDTKHNMGFRRFHLRGKKKVKAETGIVAVAHNLRKIHIRSLIKTA